MEYSVPMKRLIYCVILVFAFLSTITAQTEPARLQTAEPDDQYPTDPGSGDSQGYQPIRKGDQYIRVALGIEVPLFNIGPDGVETETNMNLGGAGIIGYSRFITPRVSLGGELAFAFNSTLGENIYLALPLTLKGTYEFVIGNFRVPVSLGIGGAFHSYRSRYYFGPVVKPEIGAYFQYSPEWSFGAATAWNMLPQWYDNSEDNRIGNLLDVTIGLRYHF